MIRYAIFLECANKSLLLLYGTQGYISPDLHDRAVPGHDSYFYRHACECSVRAVLSVTPSQTHKNEKEHKCQNKREAFVLNIVFFFVFSLSLFALRYREFALRSRKFALRLVASSK